MEHGVPKLLVDDFDAPVLTWAANTRANVTLAQSAEGCDVLRARYRSGPSSNGNFRITNHWDPRYNGATAIEVTARASRPTALAVTLREFDGTFTGPEYTAVCRVNGEKDWEAFTLPLSAFHPVAGSAPERSAPDLQRVWLMLVGDVTDPGNRGGTALEIDRIAAVFGDRTAKRGSP